MENPSDDCNNSIAIAGALGGRGMIEPDTIDTRDKEEDDLEMEKPCCSDSQLILDSILKQTPCHRRGERLLRLSLQEGADESNDDESSEQHSHRPEIAVTPTDSEALELEKQSSIQQVLWSVKGSSVSDTTVVTSGETTTNQTQYHHHHQHHNHPLFYPEDIPRSDAVFMRPEPDHFHNDLRGAIKTHHHYRKGEIMPKSLALPLKKSQVSSRVVGPGRLYLSNSPYRNPSSLLGVIEEVDEDCENE